MMGDGRIWLLCAAWMSVAASLLHIACIFGGPDWYRFFGAGEAIAQSAENGSWQPAFMTTIIAAIIMGWAIYAFSAAGYLPHVPLLRTGLILITIVLLLRSAAFFIDDLWLPEHSQTFITISSAITFIMGITFAIGLYSNWNALSKGTQ